MQTQKIALVIKIAKPTKIKEGVLEHFSELFFNAISYGCKQAEQLETSGRGTLHNGCYQHFRDIGLPSEYARMAVNQTVALVRTYYKSKDENKSFPVPKKKMGFGLGTHAYKIEKRGRHAVLRLSLGTKGTYIWFPIHIPEKYRKEIFHVKGDAKVFKKNNEWYVMLPKREEAPAVRNGEPTFIGADLGIVRLLALSSPKAVKFFGGKEVRFRKEHFANLRGRYASHNRRDKVKSNHKEQRWMRDINHKIARETVEFAKQYNNPILCFECLDGIRYRVGRKSKKFKRMMHSWAFRQLFEMVKYKAERAGVGIMLVDPRNTSRACPKCQHTEKKNRKKQSTFRCRKCGYTANADYVASRNISARGLYDYRHGHPDNARTSKEVQTASIVPDGASDNVVSLTLLNSN